MSAGAVNRKRGQGAGGMTVSAVVAALAVGLAFGMDALGVLAAFDDSVHGMLAGLGGPGGLIDFPAGVSWPLLGLICFGLAFAMIESPGGWRRLVLWISCGGVIAAAVPLAGLAARWLGPGGPMVAWLWTGVCGMIYAHRQEPESTDLRRSTSVRVAPAAGVGAAGQGSSNQGDGRSGQMAGTPDE